MAMTNREVVARLYGMWNAGRADAAFRDHWDADAVLYLPEEFPESGLMGVRGCPRGCRAAEPR